MILVEIALLGVRDFQQITRLEFRPGMNIVQGGNASGKSTLREAILLSLFSGTPEQGKSLVRRSSPSTCQTALTFRTRNEDVYRLAKDFIKDIAILSKYDSSTQKYIPIEKRRENILRWLQQEHEGLDGARITRYFSLTRENLTSLHPTRLAAPQPEVTPTVGHPTQAAGPEALTEIMADPGPQEDFAAKERRLERLKGMIKGAEEAFEVEEQLSDVQSRLGVLRRKLSQFKDLDEEIAQINERAEAFAAIKETTEDIEQLLEEFEAKRAERDREYHDLLEDQTLLEQQLVLIPSDPIHKNKLFLSGVAVTALSFATGLFFALPGLYQHLYLIGLLTGLGLMVASVIVDMQWMSRKKIMEEKLGGKLKNLELLEARFQRENATFLELLRKTDADSVEAFKEKMNAYLLIDTSRQQLQEQKERALEGKDLPSLQRECEEKTGLARQLEQRLKAFEGTPTDLPTLREEIGILEREVASRRATTLAAGLAGSPEIPDQTRTQMPNEYAGREEAPLGFLGDSIIQDRQPLIATAKDIFLRLSQGGFQDLVWDESGQIGPVPQGGSVPTPIHELSSGTRETLYLSLYLGWLQMLDTQYSFPLLLDEPLLTLDAQRQRRVLDLLREIGQKRQVILFSHLSYPVRDGEHQIRLS